MEPYLPKPGGPASPDPGAPWLDAARRGHANPAGRPEQTTPTDTRGMEMTAVTKQRTGPKGTRRFSEGIEHLPDTPEKRLTGRFSFGIERSTNTPEKTVTRRFSHGLEQLPDTPEK